MAWRPLYSTQQPRSWTQKKTKTKIAIFFVFFRSTPRLESVPFVYARTGSRGEGRGTGGRGGGGACVLVIPPVKVNLYLSLRGGGGWGGLFVILACRSHQRQIPFGLASLQCRGRVIDVCWVFAGQAAFSWEGMVLLAGVESRHPCVVPPRRSCRGVPVGLAGSEE